MNTTEVSTRAEQKAAAAETLPAFSGLKLLHIKRSVSELLRQVGGNGIFDEYTVHNISHIDAMLTSLDWIIPPDSAEKMTSADWVLTVLAIYFHDLGMLVTKDEFRRRDESDFRDFCEKVLFDGGQGIDYKSKVVRLPDDERERFLYQEFVRFHHAARIRDWVLGQLDEAKGSAGNVSTEIQALLGALDPVLRRDLAFVCESHHLDDLGNFKKYKARQPYGQLAQETANLQYVAVLLRTADLLHVTRDRTPSVTFRLISPADPVSQREWAKQSAVRAVLPMIGKDTEGNVNESVPRDTIEVHAHFRSPEGFFGLTSYLQYAEEQLRKSYEWVDLCNKSQGTGLRFPWRHINLDHVETEGFLSETFQFTLDQAKILDLLTGHTLYNDTGVVLRELVQNSIDAVRLQCLIEKEDPFATGLVKIQWNSKDRILSIEDNGTGMSQRIIERHLLKVGSSRYQEESFKKEYPQFSPISRFGIGILSAFMIADSVEIVTVHPEESLARQMTLRSVHGRYLINLLEKGTGVAKELGSHGTRITLQIRASANVDDPLTLAKKWIVVPRCRVMCSVNNSNPVEIGYSSLEKALEKQLADHGFLNSANKDRFRIEVFEDNSEGITLACALVWVDYFNEWDFLTTDYWMSTPQPWNLGLCVEGIRVEFGSPGFNGDSVVAIGNVTGKSAPRTNVARSGLEKSGETERLRETVYRLYLKHIESEMSQLEKVRGFSPTWAAKESRYLLQPFFPRARHNEEAVEVFDRAPFQNAVNDLNCLILETDGTRHRASVRDFQNLANFWTLESSFFRSAEAILKEVPGAASLHGLLEGLGKGVRLPEGPILCAGDEYLTIRNAAYGDKVPVTIRSEKAERRLDVLWGKSEKVKWIQQPKQWKEHLRHMYAQFTFVVAMGSLEISGFESEAAVTVNDKIWFFPNTAISEFLLRVFKVQPRPEDFNLFGHFLETLSRCVGASRHDGISQIENAYKEWPMISRIVAQSDFSNAMGSDGVKIFNPSRWVRGGGPDFEASEY